MQIVLPATQPDPLPGDRFRLTVELAADLGCTPPVPKDVAELVKSGLDLSLVEVIRNGTLFFRDRLHLRRGETQGTARVRKVVEILEDWHPRVEANAAGVPKLIVDSANSGEESGGLSEFLGEAIGLEVATRLTDVGYRYWSKKHYMKGVRHDYEAEGDFGPVILEARGRFRANNLSNALGGIEDKFAHEKVRRFSRTIGTVYCPRTGADDVQPDLIIVDPVGDVAASPLERRRRLLSHYASVFGAQGLFEVAHALRSAAREADFQAAFAALATPAPHFGTAGDDWGTVNATLGGIEYWGTLWSSHPFPSLPGRTSQRRAPVFLGIAKSVIRALHAKNLGEIEEMTALPFTGRLRDTVVSRAQDASLFAYPRGDEDLSLLKPTKHTR